MISIISATFNSSSFIEETYASLQCQTYSDWEWLITDDASTDDTLNIITRIAEQDTRVKIFSLEHNSGAGVARNNSIAHSSGDYFAFIDADDTWKPCKLEKQLNFMKMQNSNFSFTGYEVMDVKGVPIGKQIDTRHKRRVFYYNDLLSKKITLGCSTVMIKRCDEIKIKFPNLRITQDYVLWLSILKEDTVCQLCNLPLTLYRLNPDGISKNKFKKAYRQWKVYREVEKLNLLLSFYYFMHYAFRAVSR